ncbi:MAG: type II toxin-antitoxin system HicB family antitoxin [Porphyromonadaceae bacterium]|nr:type II toxin-antitoxin system HicB family antitoxin [Porphyromonadaceae bacterium]
MKHNTVTLYYYQSAGHGGKEMKYPFDVVFEKDENETYWLAKSKVLNHVVGKGKTPEEAIQLLNEMEDTWLEFCESEDDIPELVPTEPLKYSGRISLRLSKQTHALAAKTAAEQGISLNQYINEAVITRNTATSVCNRLLENYSAQMLKNLNPGDIGKKPLTVVKEPVGEYSPK